MKKLLLVILLVVPSLVMAYESRYEYGYQEQEQLKYNPYDGKYSYEAEENKIKYNPYENKFTYEKPDSQLRYNPYEMKFEYTK